jgi:hypothetical protein
VTRSGSLPLVAWFRYLRRARQLRRVGRTVCAACGGDSTVVPCEMCDGQGTVPL